jgi:hypothetical protein
MLLEECHSLVHMARELVEAEKGNTAYARLNGQDAPAASGAGEALPALLEREASLRAELESTWSAQKKIYAYRDYQTHLSLPGETIHEFSGPGRITSRKRFSQPRRLIIHLNANEERSYAVLAKITGFSAEGELEETLDTRGFNWHGMQARAATQNTFLALKSFEIQGIGKADQVRILTADFTQEDCSLFLPLWAGAPDAKRARQLVEDTLLPRFMRPVGIP